MEQDGDVKKPVNRFWGPKRDVTLMREEGQPLGINIIEGTLDLENNRPSDFAKGIFIKSTNEGSPAEKCGQFNKWDRILEVDGEDLRSGDIQIAIKAIKGAGDTIVISVQSLIDKVGEMKIRVEI